MVEINLPAINYDKVLRMYILDVVIDGQNEMLAFDTEEEARAQVMAFSLVKGNRVTGLL